MNAKIVLLLGLASVVAAGGRPSYGRPRYSSGSFESFESGEARYDFDWAVRHGPSRNDYGQKESRDGEHTQGSYYVQLPDGRRQTVSYLVDGGSGYLADVQYDGEARYDSASFESYERPSFESYERPSFESYGRPRYG